MASSTPFKFKKEKTYVDEDTVEGVIKKRFKTEKKPTKFTWEGARNLIATIVGTPVMKLDRIKAQSESGARGFEYAAQYKDYQD